MAKPKLVVIAGPTASGKSDLALDLCEAIGGEIISADSMQIYRGMDIGTAKTPPGDRRGIPHHMIDVADPRCPFSVAMYQTSARAAVCEILSRGKTPVVAGGTGLYIDALLYPMDFGRVTGDPTARARWETYLAEKGAGALHGELARIDAESARRLHANDTRRVIRALEVAERGDGGLSETRIDYRAASLYNCAYFVLDRPREELYALIRERVRRMMASGLLTEVQALLGAGVAPGAQSMQGLGYKELCAHILHGERLDACVELIQQRTRNYAKRQLTYFRRENAAMWLSAGSSGDTQAASPPVFEKLLTILHAKSFIS